MPLNVRSLPAEDVFRNFLQEVKEKHERIRIITAPDPQSSSVAGLISRLLKTSEIEFELVSELNAPQYLAETRIIGINIPSKSCNNCLIFESGGSNLTFKVGNNYLFRYIVLTKGIIELISEFDIVPKEVKAILAATSLVNHLPRLKKGKLSEEESLFLRSLVDEGVLSLVKGPPIINWGVSPVAEAVRFSIDVLLPSKFMNKEVGKIDANSISAELGIPKESLVTNNYIIKPEIGIKDLYMASYVSLYFSDTIGPEGLASSLINTGFWSWGCYRLTQMYPLIKSILESMENNRVEKKNGYLLIKGDPSRVSASVISKVIEGISNKAKLRASLEWRGKYYIPISFLSRSERQFYLSKGELWRGYFRISDLEEIR